MGFVVYLIYNKVGVLLSEGTIMQIIALLISIFVGIIVYFFMLLVLKMKEVRILTKAILRRI